jgi:uncharacterized protein YprB with RNaseH-like and TPR domain
VSLPDPAQPLLGGLTLRDRLRQLGAARARARRPERQERPEGPETPPGRRPSLGAGEAGDGVEIVRARYALSHRHGRTALAECAQAVAGHDGGTTVWLDTETTGLAGGTGTHVFLVGLGAFEDGAFTVEQYLLRRLSAEPRFLALIQARLAQADHLVTFNGRRFDCPLLEARCVLARLRPVAVAAHTDLIHPARRLWHRVFGTHRLTVLEAELLGAPRGEDIPGWLIPQVYVRYLRTADRASLEPILLHNRADLLALLGLHTHVAAVLRDPERTGPLDWEGAGVLLARAGDHRRAVACFERALSERRADGGPELWRLLRRGAQACRRLGDRDRERALWESAAGAVGSSGSIPRYRAQILAELSRVREHTGDRAGAREAARTALRLAERSDGGAPLLAERLRRRLGRLTPADAERALRRV